MSSNCDTDCSKDERGTCLVRVAKRYLTNHRSYMDKYVEFMIANLPVGSGEAESGIRHVIKRRMDVAGAWEESNAGMMLALLAIRASGWWTRFGPGGQSATRRRGGSGRRAR